MKITDPEIIRNGEKDLIDSVRADLDLEAVREILRHRMTASTLSSRGGQIVVHDNQIAFRLDFDFQVSGSLLFDREGNYIPDTEEPAPSAAQAPQPAEDRVSAALADPVAEADDDLGDLGLDDDDIDIPDLDLDDPAGEIGPEDDALADINPPNENFSDEDLSDEDISDVALPDMDLGPDLSLDGDDETGPAIPGIGEDDLLLDDDDDNLMGDTDDDLSAGIPDELTLEGAEDETDLMDVNLDETGLGDADLDDTDLIDTDLDDDDLLQEDMLDDDINDILKESREFWEQKKDS